MRSLLRFLQFVGATAVVVTVVYLVKVTSDRRSDSPVVSLAALDHEVTALVAKVLPAVVSIDALPPDAVNPRFQRLRMLLGGAPATSQIGSGVIVSESGHIVTNLHVISGASQVRVHLNDGRMLPAKFIGADSLSDIAILKVEAEGLTPLPLGNSDAVQVGQMVFAVGNPLGLQETVTQGIISAKGRRALSEAANEFFQTDAAINPGSSGGPLVNLAGEVIGINNTVSMQGQGIGFSIPSNTVRNVFESIRDHGRFIRPWFGALWNSLTPQLARQLGLTDLRGAVVLLVYEDSPAARAGLRPGDVIVEFNGRPIVDMIDLRNRVVATEIGETVNLRVKRDGQDLSLKAVIGPEPGA